MHLSDAAVVPGAPLAGEFGRVENTRGPVHAEQIRQWCGNPDAQITVNPVIDLNEHIDVEAYEIRGRLREQTILTHPTCVFPWCTRPARALEPDEHDADCDHRVPYAKVQHSCSCNTAPLCRRHHRAKTHGGWTYTALERGTTCGPAPTATSTSATTTAPSTCAATGTPQPAGPLHPPPGRLTPPPRHPAGPPPAGTSARPGPSADRVTTGSTERRVLLSVTSRGSTSPTGYRSPVGASSPGLDRLDPRMVTRRSRDLAAIDRLDHRGMRDPT